MKKAPRPFAQADGREADVRVYPSRSALGTHSALG